jgi:predicted dehydrogenase
VLLPELRRMSERVELRGVATASGPSAQQTMSRFGFGYASVDWRELIRDPDLDAVLVATRHDLHAEIAGEALRAGKSVLLEKPMALDEEQLSQLLATWEANPRVLQVGFNRRFSPTIRQLRAAYAGRRDPLVLQYRVNAGAVASGSWVVDPEQGGGRLVGEVCHMVDTLFFLTGAPVERVWAQPLPRPTADDVALTLGFADGSIGTIVYAAGGDRGMPKERLEVFGGGVSAVLDDFVSLTLFEKGRARRPGRWRTQNKGHAAELSAFVDAALRGGPSPIHPLDAAHVTRVTFAAARSARSGEPIVVGR